MQGDVTLHITICPKLKAKLVAKAKRERVTVAGLVRVLLAREVAQNRRDS